MTGGKALKLQNLSVAYGQTVALEDVRATVDSGTVVGVIGPNGSGKSTLLKAIAGVLEPQAGRILYGDSPLRQSETSIAYVPQSDEVSWDFPLSIRDVVMMGRYRSIGWLRRPGAGDRQRVDAALARLGLEEMADRHISQCSGGQQQRIFLARTLVQDPDIVLFDEPTTGIDAANREILHGMIGDFANAGAIVLVATHDLDEVQHVSDTILCLNRRMVAYGPTATTFTPETLRAAFGGKIAVFTQP